MYGVGLTAAACLRAGTRVDVAWIVDDDAFPTRDRTDALTITPGGGRIGSLLSGALDGTIADLAARQPARGRLVTHTVSDVDALIAGLPKGGTVRFMFAPGDTLPSELWPTLLAREPICLVSTLDGDVIVAHELHTEETIESAPERARELFSRQQSGTFVGEHSIVTVLRPVPKLVVAGRGPIADALVSAAGLLGWQIVSASDADTAVGLVMGLSRLDHVVVIQHDIEAAGRILATALSSEVGYIGAVGAPRMQALRAEWLAYRGIVDIERINGPAGLAIGASSPAEVALAILAEALAVTRT